MRPKLIWILLAVSLVANVFFAGGAIYAFCAHRDYGGRQISRQLDLNPAQVQGLKALRETVASRRGAGLARLRGHPDPRTARKIPRAGPGPFLPSPPAARSALTSA